MTYDLSRMEDQTTTPAGTDVIMVVSATADEAPTTREWSHVLEDILAAVRAAFPESLWRGAWISGAAYDQRDIVESGHHLYIAVRDIPADPANPPPVDSGSGWAVLTQRATALDAVPEHNVTGRMAAVRFGSATYEVEDVQARLRAAEGVRWRGSWATATAYRAEDIVTTLDNLYLCLQGHTSGATITVNSHTYWQWIGTTDYRRLSNRPAIPTLRTGPETVELLQGLPAEERLDYTYLQNLPPEPTIPRFHGPVRAGLTYEVGALVQWESGLYECTARIQSLDATNSPPSTAYWTLAYQAPRPDWDAAPGTPGSIANKPNLHSPLLLGSFVTQGSRLDASNRYVWQAVSPSLTAGSIPAGSLFFVHRGTSDDPRLIQWQVWPGQQGITVVTTAGATRLETAQHVGFPVALSDFVTPGGGELSIATVFIARTSAGQLLFVYGHPGAPSQETYRLFYLP